MEDATPEETTPEDTAPEGVTPEQMVEVTLGFYTSADPYIVADRVSHAVHNYVPDKMVSVWWLNETAEDTEGPA